MEYKEETTNKKNRKTMKKIMLLTTAIIALIFSACSKSDDTKEEDEKYDCKIEVSLSSATVGVGQVLDVSYTLSKPATEYYMEDEEGNKYKNQKELEWIPTKEGKQKLKFVADNGAESVSVEKEINVVLCDMGVGRWGDSNEYIQRCESVKPTTLSSGMLRYNGSYGERVYYFEKGLNRGFQTATYEFGTGIESNLLLCMSLYRTALDNMKKQYGNPVSYSDDVYSFTNNNKYEKGDDLYEAQRIINGEHKITYKFKSKTTEIDCILQEMPNKKLPWSSQIVRTYKKL